MERHAFNLFRRASQSSNDAAGTVRVAVTEGPGNFWILPRLIDFQKTYRKITVDLRCAMEQADVARLEADIAIQLERADKSGPHRREARQASHLSLRFRRISQRCTAFLHRSPSSRVIRIIKQTRAASRRYRLCTNFGTDLAGRRRRDQDKFQHRGSVRGRTRRRYRFPAEFVHCAGRAVGRGRPGRLQPSCRPLAHLSQGVSQLRSTQNRHRLDQENLRSQGLSLLPGRVHPPERSDTADDRVPGEFRTGRDLLLPSRSDRAQQRLGCAGARRSVNGSATTSVRLPSSPDAIAARRETCRHN